VRWLAAFGRFWWDFLVGDDWTIAAGVLVALALTWALTQVEDFPAWIVLPAAGALIQGAEHTGMEIAVLGRRQSGKSALIQRLRGVPETAFIDVPAPDAAGGADPISPAFLPRCDFAFVLVDAHSGLVREDLQLLNTLKSAGIPAMVIVTRCDLLTRADVERATARAGNEIARHLKSELPVISFSSSESWSGAVDASWDQVIAPLLKASRAERIQSVAGQAEGLRKSLLRALLTPRDFGGATAMSPAVEQQLRHLDELLAAFRQKWDHRIQEAATREKEVIDLAASRLAHGPADKGPTSEMIINALTAASDHFGSSFGEDYQAICNRLSVEIEELRKAAPADSLIAQKLPGISAFSRPTASFPDGLNLRPPDSRAHPNVAARTRYFRAELQDKSAAQLAKMLQDLQPRLEHWIRAAIEALNECVRLQTDPLRYADAVEALPGVADRRNADIAALQETET
jgi:GTP-binding protein EngB required for normal cell division